MTVFYMILATLAGSVVSLVGGLLLLRAKKRRQAAILLTLPFGAGALLAAAFFDLLPEAFELGDPGATALLVYSLGSDAHLPVAPLLALTAGFFIYVAASDIIPEIHEQPHRTGMIQAVMLLAGIAVVGTVVTLLGV